MATRRSTPKGPPDPVHEVVDGSESQLRMYAAYIVVLVRLVVLALVGLGLGGRGPEGGAAA